MRNFSLFGTTSVNRPGDALHLKHMEDLKRMIEIARGEGMTLVVGSSRSSSRGRC